MKIQPSTTEKTTHRVERLRGAAFASKAARDAKIETPRREEVMSHLKPKGRKG